MLAIDGGNSKTDVALVADDGTLLASARGPGINAHEVGIDQTVLILDAVVKQAADRLDRRVATQPVVLGGGVITTMNPLLMTGIRRQVAEAARIRVIDVPPVADAALLGLDHVHAAPAATSRLRAAYDD